jgi:hypothetical protein
MRNDIASCAHLPDNSALENYKHEEGENAVIPVLVEHPKGHAEDLEDEEWCGSMLSKQSAEGRNRDVELVLSVH